MSSFTLDQLLAFKRPDLQAHCKARDIKAGGKNAALVDALRPFVSADADGVKPANHQNMDSEPQPQPEQEPQSTGLPLTAEMNTTAPSSEPVMTPAQVRTLVESAVSAAQSALQSAFHERLDSLERRLEQQQQRIFHLEAANAESTENNKPPHAPQQQQQQQPVPPVPDTPGLHVTRPDGRAAQLSGQEQDDDNDVEEDDDDAMEDAEVADSLSPLPKRPRWPQAPAPSSPNFPLAGLSSPVGNASSTATVGARTPAGSPPPPARATGSPLASNAPTPSASSSTAPSRDDAPFSFLQNGAVPPAPISPPRPSSSSAAAAGTAMHSMPLASLPHPITFNPFQFSPQKPSQASQQQKHSDRAATAAQTMPSVFNANASTLLSSPPPKRASPSRSAAQGGPGPIRRSRPSAASRPTAARPPVGATPVSKASAFGHERTQGSARFADMGETCGGLFGSATSWRQWQ